MTARRFFLVVEVMLREANAADPDAQPEDVDRMLGRSA